MRLLTFLRRRHSVRPARFRSRRSARRLALSLGGVVTSLLLTGCFESAKRPMTPAGSMEGVAVASVPRAKVVKPPAGVNISYPKAIVAGNRAGFVLSPYGNSKSWVDVRGIKSGADVRCPYTGRIFVVP